MSNINYIMGNINYIMGNINYIITLSSSFGDHRLPPYPTVTFVDSTNALTYSFIKVGKAHTHDLRFIRPTL